MRIPQELMLANTLTAFPELKKYSSSIYLIDASVGLREIFVIRDTNEIVEEIRQAHAQGKTKFMFNLFTETVMIHIVFKIHRIANLLSDIIPPENFFYLTGVINGQEAYNKVAENFNFPFRINVLSASMQHYFLKGVMQMYPVNFDTFEVTVKPKKFLCFNKVEREQRIRLLERMLEKKYVELGHYSFETNDVKNICRFVRNLNPIRFPNIKANKHILPLRLNINEERTNPVNVIPEDLQYFRDSYFSIVNETIYYGYNSSSTNPLHHQPLSEDLSVFVTEKTYKCLAVKHPFVVFGRPNFIKGLHKLGFKTFSPYFNESYDDIIDDDERFDVVFNEVERLINLSDDEWLDILRNIEPILHHNYLLFYSTEKYSTTTNIERFL
jgi:hypothetical protein